MWLSCHIWAAHLGSNASLAVLSHGEHPASKLLMLSLAEAVKPQIALETSCCDGCTSPSFLKIELGAGSPTALVLPNKPLLPESQRKGAGASRASPHARLGAESSSAWPRVWGPVTIKDAVKHPGETLPFHVAEEEGRSGEKQNPREAAGLPMPAAASHGVARWGGWGGSQHHLCILLSSPVHPVGTGPKGSWDHAFCVCVGLTDKTRASGGEEGHCHASPPCRAARGQTQPCCGRATHPSAPTNPQGSPAARVGNAHRSGFA